VAFSSDATNLVSGDTNRVSDVFVHDRETGATERVSLGYTPRPDARRVVLILIVAIATVLGLLILHRRSRRRVG
jgi:hypothetical protein